MYLYCEEHHAVQADNAPVNVKLLGIQWDF